MVLLLSTRTKSTKSAIRMAAAVDDHTPCGCCGKLYNTPEDDKLDEYWYPCGGNGYLDAPDVCTNLVV